MTNLKRTNTESSLNVFFSPAYTAAACEFDTTRKSGWIARSLSHRPIPGVRIIAPEPLSARQLEAVHAPEYVARRPDRRGARAGGIKWFVVGPWVVGCRLRFGGRDRRCRSRGGADRAQILTRQAWWAAGNHVPRSRRARASRVYVGMRTAVADRVRAGR